MEAEGALPGGCGVLLLGVGDDDGGVEVQDQAVRPHPVSPGLSPSGGPRPPQGTEPCTLQAIDHPPGGGVAGHPAEEVGMVAQDAEVGEAVAAVRQHHREIADHDPGVVLAPAAEGGCQAGGEGSGQAQPIGQLVEQETAGVADDAVAVRGHQRALQRAGTLHLRSAS